MTVQEIVSNQKKINHLAIEQMIVKIQEKAQTISTWNREMLVQLIGLIDLTTLEGTDNLKKIQELCQLADSIPDDYGISQSVYSICVYPSMVSAVKSTLKNPNVKIASVACAFPSGQLPLHLKLEEVRYAIEQGADEIDMVIFRGAFLAGDYQTTFDEVKAVKEVCGKDVLLKVILETGELETLENIRLASDISIAAGADFIKTSTGKINQGASLEAIYVMCEAIQDFYEATGKAVGVKASGGVRSIVDAYQYMQVIETILGSEWLNPLRTRFGASSLTTNILKAL